MTIIKAIIHDRRLEVDAPADWPDGTEVMVRPIVETADGGADTLSPDEIAATLAAMDQIVPFDMSWADPSESST